MLYILNTNLSHWQATHKKDRLTGVFYRQTTGRSKPP